MLFLVTGSLWVLQLRNFRHSININISFVSSTDSAYTSTRVECVLIIWCDYRMQKILPYHSAVLRTGTCTGTPYSYTPPQEHTVPGTGTLSTKYHQGGILLTSHTAFYEARTLLNDDTSLLERA
jgi:hypothetical protein